MNPPRLAALVLSSLCAAPALAAQGHWDIRSSLNVPRNTSPAMVFETSRNVSILLVSSGSKVETWEWDGAQWFLRVLSNSPSSDREGHAAVFDPGRGAVVLFGGQIPGPNPGSLNETWEFDGITWVQQAPTTKPARRADHAMAYDPVRQRTVMFGGIDRTNLVNAHFSDTWEWDGTAWSLRFPVTLPPPRQGHAMVHDSNRDRIVMFGGMSGSTPMNDTWEWDGSNWTEVFPATSPSARHGHAMAFDTTRSRTFLFGGDDGFGMLRDCWEWDGTDWSQIVPLTSPARRNGHAMVYDQNRDRMVMFGGSNGSPLQDTWEYTAGQPGAFSTFGTGCLGTRGVPTIETSLGTVPVAGQSFTVQINNLPLTATTLMFIGTSNTQYGILPLPFDLTPLGMLGCTLYASGDFAQPVTNVLGVGLWTAQIPSNVVGATFYIQTIVFDPGANSIGVVTSDAGKLEIGG